jgi:hypothetical protein
MPKKSQTAEDRDIKLTMVYHEIVFCKESEIESHIKEAEKNKHFKHYWKELKR